MSGYREVFAVIVSAICVFAAVLLINSAWHFLAYQKYTEITGVVSGAVTYGKAIALDIRYAELNGIWRYPAVMASYVVIFMIAKNRCLWKTVTK